jgi:TDG/mug DNA glycosylase family protein
MPRPSPAELEAARSRTVDDLVVPGLRVLFCGINPGLYSGWTGYHFARPGNRFWKVLHLAGFSDRVLAPSEGAALLARGCGITNLVRRTTASADELTTEELREGGELLRALVKEVRPRWLAVVGVTAYRVAFDDPSAQAGRQAATIGETGIWVLPNPSGLNAHYQVPELVDAFAALERASR